MVWSGKLNGVTVTANDILETNNIENITFQFIAAGIVSGNGILTLLGSNDGVTYTAISFVDPTPANTNAQTLTRLLSRTLNGNGSAVGVIENLFKFLYLKFNIAVTTDGSYSVVVHGDKKEV